MKKAIVALVIAIAWLAAVSAQAEFLAEKTGEGFTIYQITKVKQATLPEVPDGLILSEKEALSAYLGQPVKKDLEERLEVKQFFPIPIIQNITPIMGVRWENSNWAVEYLSLRRFGGGSIFFSVLLLVLVVLMLIIGIRDRVDNKKRKTKKLIWFYAGNFIAAVLVVVALKFAGVDDSFFLGAITLIVYTIGCLVSLFLLSHILCLAITLVFLTTLMVLGSAGNSYVIWQYLIFLAGLMALSFLIGEGIYRYRGWKLKRLVSQVSVGR